MSIESEIFKRSKPDTNKLEKYGFVFDGEKYNFKKKFLDNFEARIIVSDTDVVGKVFDLDMNEEYTSFRVDTLIGNFAGNIKTEYEKLLNDILNNCFKNEYFILPQSNRIADLIYRKYEDKPEFLWEKFKGYGVFKNRVNNKWYGLIANVDKSKISSESGETEIINLKLNDDLIKDLLKRKGFYNAYHMNKENWISISLENLLDDEEIMSYVEESHKYTEESDAWIVPANTKYFDVPSYIKENKNNLIWTQSKNMNVNDYLYIYLGAPYSAIMYKCKIIETNIPYGSKNVVKLKLLKSYDKDMYPFDFLKKMGVKAIRGPRRMPIELHKFMD